MGLLGLVEGRLGCWPGDILLVDHRDGDVAPGELVTPQAAPAGGGGQAGRGGGGRAVRSSWRLASLQDTERRGKSDPLPWCPDLASFMRLLRVTHPDLLPINLPISKMYS